MALKKVKIKILATDIYKTSYTNSTDCAITRALHRAGLLGYEDAGTGIDNEKGLEVINNANKDYTALAQKVMDMYRYADPDSMCQGEKRKPVDFSITLELNI